MSKTFECMNPVVELTITKGFNGNINFIINHELRGSTKATLEKSAGADAALAILEAAGVEAKDFAESDDAEMAVAHLTSHVGMQRAKAAEAKEQAELEAEALEMLNAWVNAQDYDAYSSWADVEEVRAKIWLAVARKAREIGAEK